MAPAAAPPHADSAGGVGGRITINGSSTVFPFARAASRLFRSDGNATRISLGRAGTGGGFEMFCNGEIDVVNASRPIDRADEAPICRRHHIAYGGLRVANDGVAVIANEGLQVDCLSLAQLRALWRPGSRVRRLSALDPGLPDEPLTLYGLGPDSGRWDFFTLTLNGDYTIRNDYRPFEDGDRDLVEGVARTDGALGFVEYPYRPGRAGAVRVVAVNGGPAGCVKPSPGSIQSKRYAPFSRPLYMYVSKRAFSRREVRRFLAHTVRHSRKIARRSMRVPLSAGQIRRARKKLIALRRRF